MKKYLTIKATIEIDDEENNINTFDDCLNDYDNIDRPLERLKDHGWLIDFVSLNCCGDEKLENTNIDVDRLLSVLNFDRYPKYTKDDVHFGMPYDGWSGIAITNNYNCLLAECHGDKVFQCHFNNGKFNSNYTLIKNVIAYI